MKRWRVRPATAPLRGAIRVPGDSAIAIRALLLASIANGTSTIGRVPSLASLTATKRALAALGVTVHDAHDGAVRIDGVGLDGLTSPSKPLDAGASSLLVDLLAGFLAGQHVNATITGDASIARHATAALARALRNRGARIDGVLDAERNEEILPLTIRALPNGARLNESEIVLDLAGGNFKSALLLSALVASGPTLVREPLVTPDHTERLLGAMGVPVRAMGPIVGIDTEDWDRTLAPITLELPGDSTAAAPLLVAAHVVPGSRVIVRDCGINPTRTGVIDVLRDMGGSVGVVPKGETANEPYGDLHVGANGPSPLMGPARVGGELAVRCIDEIPALVAAAVSVPRGMSEFRDIRAVHEHGARRITGMVALLRAFRLEVEILPDGLRVPGGQKPTAGGTVRTFGDPLIATASTVLALMADGESVIDDVGCVDAVFPHFAASLRKLGVDIDEMPS